MTLTTLYSIRLDPGMREELAVLARAHGRTAASLIRWLVRREFERLLEREGKRNGDE